MMDMANETCISCNCMSFSQNLINFDFEKRDRMLEVFTSKAKKMNAKIQSLYRSDIKWSRWLSLVLSSGLNICAKRIHRRDSRKLLMQPNMDHLPVVLSLVNIAVMNSVAVVKVSGIKTATRFPASRTVVVVVVVVVVAAFKTAQGNFERSLDIAYEQISSNYERSYSHCISKTAISLRHCE